MSEKLLGATEEKMEGGKEEGNVVRDKEGREEMEKRRQGGEGGNGEKEGG